MRLADLSDNDPLKAYLSELAAIPPLNSDEFTVLVKQIRNGNEGAAHAEKRLIEANLSLVVAVAERFHVHGCHTLDLIQRGNEGLLLAVKSFTGQSSENFSAYAVACIESALSKVIGESQ